MRLVIQRVSKARVSANNKVLGAISEGLFVLVAVSDQDKDEDALKLADKLGKLRIMADNKGKMNLSVKDVDASLLVVSQFTLYADTSAGNRPSFIQAASPDHAKKIYKIFITQLKNQGINVETGEFGEYMKIDLVLDGPVTIIMEEN